MTPKGKFIGFMVFGIVFLDQCTKYVIVATIPVNHSIPLVEHLFNLVHIRNPGAAFGFLASSDGILRWLFLVIFSLAAMVFIVILLRRLSEMETFLISSLTFILGGAFGNLIDRVIYGEVVDFLDLYWYAYHWPAFNIADSFITVGVLLTLWRLMGSKGEDPFAAS